MSKTPKNLSLDEAVRAARDTRRLEIGPGSIRKAPQAYRAEFGAQPALVVADDNTFRAAGEIVLQAFREAGQPVLEPVVFPSDGLYAEQRFVAQLEETFRQRAAIPVAVGSGTINDLTKLAAHRTDRPYMAVGTAASMDGYTAFGASITFQGSKQTFLCPAPTVMVADSDVICRAPTPMNSWGYADLLAKVTAGADWLAADALGVEPVGPEAWGMVQGRLRELVADPSGVRANQPEALNRLIEGLLLGGFAMQAHQSSRPASGAEHQFSHLWDMQHHTCNGLAPSHGFKVGIGTLAVTALYERLLAKPLDQLDVERCCAAWPERNYWAARVRDLFGQGDLATVAREEVLGKYIERATLRDRLQRLRNAWPELKRRLRAQLIPLGALREMLQAAGAPVDCEEIGVSRGRLRASYWQAYFIRRRFTVLDLAVQAEQFDDCLEEIFGRGGAWPLANDPKQPLRAAD